MAKILVVDDEPNNVRILTLDLEDEGHEIVAACDGLDGWGKLEEHGTSIKLVLLDRMMPNMNGMEFMKKIKSDTRFKKIPVIMQTAAAEKEQVIEGIKSGVYYYLTKPYDEDILISVVNAALDDYTNQSELREALQAYKQCFGMTTHSEWEFKTLEQCRDMALFMASYFPDPERVVVGLSELFINAVEHGNLGITYEEKTKLNNQGTWEQEIEARLEKPENKDKKVNVIYKKLEAKVEITIIDEGKGFEWQEYLDFSSDRATHSHGRGIAMSKLMSFDELEYQGCGNTVICRVEI